MEALDKALTIYAKVSTSLFHSWNYLPWPRMSPLFRELEDGLRQSSLYVSSVVTAAMNKLGNKSDSKRHQEQSLLEKVI